MEFVPRTRRIQGLDKQVDYGPSEHLSKEWCQNRASTGLPQQSYQFRDWIWDHTRQSLPTLQGEHISDHTSNVFNLFSCVADELDLRSNPFKGGGDGVILERPEEEVKPPGHEEEQCNQMEMDHYKGNVDYKGNLAQEEGETHELGHGREDPALESMPTAQEVCEEATAQLEKPISLFASKAQEGEFSKWWKGPITRSRVETQRKPILQVAWAWLRRKRKKPRRLNQVGLINFCIFCKLGPN